MMDRSTLVTETLNRGFAGLRFPAPIEARFIQDSAAQRLLLIQISGIASVVFFAGVLAADLFMIPDQISLALALRVGMYAPICLAGLWLLSRFDWPRLREWGATGAGLLAAAISIVLSLSSHSPQALAHLVILNMVVIYATMIGRFWPMLVMCVLIAAGHMAAVLIKGELFSSLGMAMTLLLLSTMVFTLYGNYALEHSDRKVYLLDQREGALQAELAQTNDTLARSVRTDPLTGLPNRRHFDDFMGQVWAHSQAQSTSMALLLIDIDHFKRYNDLKGHPAGDRCLHDVAETLGACVRKSGDLLARWGGEEFAVVMSNTSLESATVTAQRMVDAVRARAIPHGASPSGSVLTVSIGVAALTPALSHTPENLVEQADAALYLAKLNGRDRAQVSQGQPPTSIKARA